jgi:hypothetical protein
VSTERDRQAGSIVHRARLVLRQVAGEAVLEDPHRQLVRIPEWCQRQHDLIGFDAQFQTINIGHASNRGVELMADGELGSGKLGVDATFQDPRDDDVDTPLLRRARTTAAIAYRVPVLGWETGVWVRYTGKRSDVDPVTFATVDAYGASGATLIHSSVKLTPTTSSESSARPMCAPKLRTPGIASRSWLARVVMRSISVSEVPGLPTKCMRKSRTYWKPVWPSHTSGEPVVTALIARNARTICWNIQISRRSRSLAARRAGMSAESSGSGAPGRTSWQSA